MEEKTYTRPELDSMMNSHIEKNTQTLGQRLKERELASKQIIYV